MHMDTVTMIILKDAIHLKTDTNPVTEDKLSLVLVHMRSRIA